MTALPAPSVALDDQLCFALYAASRAVTARYRPMLDVLGLTYPQYLVMMLLWESDHQTVGQLGSRLALDSGTLSPLLKRLTAAGLVTRHRRVEDERSVSIALTDEGRALRGQGRSRISEEMIGAIGFDTGEFDELKDRAAPADRAGQQRRRRLLTDTPPPGRACDAPSRSGRRPAGRSRMATRTARTAWNGTLQEGSGRTELASSGLGTFDVSWPKRTSDAADGSTSPEELIAAAHAVLLRDGLLRAGSPRPAARPQSPGRHRRRRLSARQGARRLHDHRRSS